MMVIACSKCGRGDMIKLMRHSENNKYWLSCDKCGYNSSAMNSEIDAVESWNMEHKGNNNERV